MPGKKDALPFLKRTFRGHKDVVTSLSFSSNMSQLVSGSLDSSVIVWNMAPQMRANRFMGHKGPVFDVDCGKERIASASKDGTIRLWVPTVKGHSSVVKAHTAAVRSVSFSKDEKFLLTSSDDKSLKLWAMPGKFISSFVGHTNWVRTSALSSDMTNILSGSDDSTVKVWDIGTKKCVSEFNEISGYVTNVKYHPSETSIAASGADGTVKLWDVRSNSLIQYYTACTGGCANKICFHSSGNYMASVGDDSVVKVWDIREGHLLFSLKGHTGPVFAAEFVPGKDVLATAGTDKFVMLWDSKLGQEMSRGKSKKKGGAKRPKKASLDEELMQEVEGWEQEFQLQPQSEDRPAVLASDPPPPPMYPREEDEAIAYAAPPQEEEVVAEPVPMAASFSPAAERLLQQLAVKVEMIASTLQLMDRRLRVTEDKMDLLMSKDKPDA